MNTVLFNYWERTYDRRCHIDELTDTDLS